MLGGSWFDPGQTLLFREKPRILAGNHRTKMTQPPRMSVENGHLLNFSINYTEIVSFRTDVKLGYLRRQKTLASSMENWASPRACLPRLPTSVHFKLGSAFTP